MNEAAIEVVGLGKTYAGKAVLSDVSFRVEPGEVVALLGPSGSGKTTLFRCLTRLVEADLGKILWFGRAVTDMRRGELRRSRRDIGLIFQHHNLIRRRSALDNALAGRLGHVALWRAVAGHSKFEKYTLDTHDHPVLDPVWALYARAIERTGETATLLEWDDNIPSFEEVHAEALKAKRYLASPDSPDAPILLPQGAFREGVHP